MFQFRGAFVCETDVTIAQGMRIVHFGADWGTDPTIYGVGWGDFEVFRILKLLDFDVDLGFMR